jgi:hypothetical protein
VIQLGVMTMQSRHRGKYIKDILVVVMPLCFYSGQTLVELLHGHFVDVTSGCGPCNARVHCPLSNHIRLKASLSVTAWSEHQHRYFARETYVDPIYRIE